ncbi:MAG: hypothetical protein N2035_10115 [Chthoniobacterales bacterium]|nr:hypothetical protein [Chthoniobacterales bacterium]
MGGVAGKVEEVGDASEGDEGGEGVSIEAADGDRPIGAVYKEAAVVAES